MTHIVSFISQKGGVGKSTLARALATECAKGGHKVKVADLDTQQGTFLDWHLQRLNNGKPRIGSVESYAKAEEAFQEATGFDVLIFDGAARASKATLEIAAKSDLAVLPTGASRDDLVPAIALANQLIKAGVSEQNLVFALTRISTDAESKEARVALENQGFKVLAGHLPDKAAFKQAQNDGLAVTETRFQSLNQKADEMIEDLINFLSE